MSWRTAPLERSTALHRTRALHRTTPIQRPPSPAIPVQGLPAWLRTAVVWTTVFDTPSRDWANANLGPGVDGGILDEVILAANFAAYGHWKAGLTAPVQLGWKGWNYPTLSAGRPGSGGTYAAPYALQPAGGTPSGPSGNYGYASIAAAGGLSGVVSISNDIEYGYTNLAELTDGTHYLTNPTNNNAALAEILAAHTSGVGWSLPVYFTPDFLFAGTPTGFANWGALSGWTVGTAAYVQAVADGYTTCAIQSQHLQPNLASWVAIVPGQIAAAHAAGFTRVILQFNANPPTYTLAQIVACLLTLSGTSIPEGISLFASAGGTSPLGSVIQPLFTAMRQGPWT